MSTPSDTFEDQLRQQLQTSTPQPYAGLDPSAVIGAGERVVRRRRLGTALVAAVVVAAVAVGAGALTGGRPVSAPQPAAPSGPTTSATISLDGVLQTNGEYTGPQQYTVSLGAADADGRRAVRYQVAGEAGAAGSGVDEHDRRMTWGHGSGSNLVLGLLPSGTAQDRLFVDLADSSGGASTSRVVPIPGTDWSAFAVQFDHPLVGDEPIGTILWFDDRGYPVDATGRIGGAAVVDSVKVWASADGRWWGTDGSTDFAGKDVEQTITSQAGKHVLVAIVRNEVGAASRLTAVLADGSTHAVTSAPVGPYQAISVPVASADPRSQRLDSIRWTDASGRQQTKTVMTGS